MTKAFALNFSMKALFFLACLDHKKRLPKLVRQSLLIVIIIPASRVRSCRNYLLITFLAALPLARSMYMPGSALSKSTIKP